ncbi:hypothetical protein RvY_14295-2 [Ramazzottius varieornatus]|uniref:RIMS-binding protein 2 n=1 Tax=Ramazzottius varieornatus TaxID=947166 RepID=A0A1D1VY32_RAMVA|nr:hypothetical protein RvY_14295-2 [Ramazzottius varieornatus]
MSSVQKQASRSKSGVNLTSSEVQTSPESETSTPDSALSSSVRMVNGEGSRFALQQQQQKPRLGTQKTDSGLGSSLDESISSRRTDSSTRSSTLRQHLLHPLFESVDRAVDVGPSEDQKLSVYVAKYAYNPAKISPNHDIADLELELKKGEFVIVFGDIDEDGYFEGETLDGRHGLVPSNYVERLPPEELVDFHASYPNNPALTTSSAKASSSRVTQSSVHFSTNINAGTVPGTSGSVTLFESRRVGGVQHSSGSSTARGATMDFRSDNSNTRPSDFSQKLPSTHSSAAKRETSSEDPNVPPPSNLTLEKQMHKSIMIGWTPAPANFVECYNVYVNRVLKTTIRGNERCRALVEGIDLSFCHRVSVRSCTGAGRESLDSLCTILVGKDCPVMPTELRVINISATSATVTWIPANSSYQHTIFVNEREYVTVPASSHHIVIPDLLPNTDYKIHVVPVVPKSTVSFSNYLQACAQVGFKTLPDNVPDPPSTLQLESGPQDGTLLLTWTPVIPPANCDVTGYAIYADGQRVQQIDSPTGDHALLDITRLQPPLPRTLTVRTISSKNVSRDSPFLSVTEDVLLGHVKAVAQAQSAEHTHLTPLTPLPPVSPAAGSRQNTVTFRDPPNNRQGPPPQINVTAPNRIPPEYYGQNEEPLMDIMEETEDQMMGGRPMFDSYGRRVPGPQQFGQRNMAGRPNTLPPGARDFGPPPGPGGFMGPPRHSGPMSFLVRPFENMSIGSFPPRGPHAFGPRGPFPRFGPRFEGPRFGGPPGPGGPFGGPNPFDAPFFEGRQPNLPFGMYERTTSLPQIEITKEDSFESMDSRHRAYSDREAEERGYYRGGPRGSFDSPPNDLSNRRMRSQSRDRFEMEGPSRYSRGNQERLQSGPMINNYASLDRRAMPRQQRPAREAPRGKYEYPDEGPKRRDESEGRDRARSQQGVVQSGGGASGQQGGNLDKIKNKLVRLFRTNRDFDAATESPNADAAAEELSFRANELIKVTGTKDQDGFYQGELIGNGRQGMVGCNLVTVVDDERLVRKYLGEEATVDRPRPSALKGGSKGANVTIKEPTRGPIKKMIAKYDYEVSNSPNPDFEKELSFKKGDVIYVSGIMDEDGFFEGEHQASGKQGLVPSNYLIDPATEGTTAAATSQSSTLTRNPSLRERDPSASRSTTNQQGGQQRPGSANPQHRQTTTADVHGGNQPKR